MSNVTMEDLLQRIEELERKVQQLENPSTKYHDNSEPTNSLDMSIMEESIEIA
jgi:hypothetical protein